MKRLNEVTHGECPGTVTVAEESTAWPQVSRPTYAGGLGFTLKWNMGWMHDTLSYMTKDPVHRQFHHNLLTFGPIYVFSENFVSPLSHDEVVHGKRSLLDKMPGDDWQRFANLRLLLTYQWTYPGKKLLFMGGEFGQPREWNPHESLPWHLADEPRHAGVRALVRDLNRVYRETPALHRRDHDGDGFAWLSWQDSQNSVLTFVRKDGDAHAIVLLNFTPIPRHGYRVGVPARGTYREISELRFELLRRVESRQPGAADRGRGVHGPRAIDRRHAAAARGARARPRLKRCSRGQAAAAAVSAPRISRCRAAAAGTAGRAPARRSEPRHRAPSSSCRRSAAMRGAARAEASARVACRTC